MARLILSLKGRELDKFLLGQGKVIIGRTPDCDIKIDNPAISRNHASIEFSGGDYLLTDLGSSNGTYLNGQLLNGPGRLKPGDIIGIAKFELIFQDTPQAELDKVMGGMDLEATMMVDADNVVSSLKTSAEASPAYSGPRKLVILKGDTNTRELPIERDVITIGKEAHCDIVVKGFFLDKIEATLIQKQGKYYLTPLGGSVKLNDRKLDRETLLKAGDTFSVGKALIAFT